jgi:U3 small nucleolar RNA-associated protein 18
VIHETIPSERGDSQYGDIEQDSDSAANTHVPEEVNEHVDRLLNDGVDSSKPATVAPLDSRIKKTAAWADPDDQNIQVSLASDKRLRKLRDGPEEDKVGGRDYEARLRRQYAFGSCI